MGMRRNLLATAVISFVTAGGAAEPTVLRLAQNEFNENFDGKSAVRTSGSELVGVFLGLPSGQFQPELIQTSLRSAPRLGNLCLAVASRDGRYSSENLYAVSAVPAGPATFDFRSSYRDLISAYPTANMAILIRDTESCTGEKYGTVLPNILPGGSNVLTVMLNAPARRLKVDLRRPGGAPPIAGKCEQDSSQTSISFSSVCSIDLGGKLQPGEYELGITVRERFDSVSRSVAVRFE